MSPPSRFKQACTGNKSTVVAPTSTMCLTFANTAAYVPGSTPVAGPWGDAFGNALSVPKDSRKLTCDVKSLR